ncbi:cell surface glycoprotein CD200 receptor 1-like [Hyperolius riggenbachi]|uniref:cell surface glycoprotein CD200 receptor 1-like n=1 Tax=Hyperolius riggenbachi TaxID=752182 RepID=UPI0035A2DE05
MRGKGELRTHRRGVTTVHSGNNASLICEHDRGNHFVMSTWKISLPNRPMCFVTFSVGNQTFHNCSDRIHHDVGFKQINLSIVNVTISDEGHYTCEALNETGHSTYNFTLEVLAQPSVSLELNSAGSPECRAIGGYPAAEISWMPHSYNTHTTQAAESDQSWTVISTYGLHGDNVTSVTCSVSHPTFVTPWIQSVNITASRRNYSSSTDFWRIMSLIIFICTVIGLLTYCKYKRGVS